MIAERLKDERKRQGYTQDGFAKIAGVSRRAYAEWESGNTSPAAAQLSALAAIGVDVLYIVTGERSGSALTPDERELLSLFRAAPLAVKAAAIGALQGGTQPQSGRVVIATGGSVAAGRKVRIWGKNESRQ